MKTLTETTRTIAGHSITLISGVRYFASRPFASRGRRIFPITFVPMIGAPLEARTVTIDGLDYKQANALVNAFNDGEISFDGRQW
jgi:hypothetical protein